MRVVGCPRTCPAAFVIEGAAPSDRKVICGVESTSRGLRVAKHGPVSVIRERTSPASLHGFCLGDLQQWVDEVEQLGALANREQRRAAAQARAEIHRRDYTDCPSWRAEKDNRRTTKLVDLPGKRRVLGPSVAA